VFIFLGHRAYVRVLVCSQASQVILLCKESLSNLCNTTGNRRPNGHTRKLLTLYWAHTKAIVGWRSSRWRFSEKCSLTHTDDGHKPESGLAHL
jgi:hypothetical protein